MDRVPAPKRVPARLTPNESKEHLHVKFVEGSGVRLRGGRFESVAGTDLGRVHDLVESGTVARVDRLFDRDETELDDMSRKAADHSGRAQADLNLWYRLRVAPGSEPLSVIKALSSLDVVETAYAEPLHAAPPGSAVRGARRSSAGALVAPDFRPRQGYRLPASAGGVDAEFALTVPGGRGGNVRVLDIEYAWNSGHEDLSKLRAPGANIPNGTPHNPFTEDHGTAVAGQLSGDDNNGGVLGLVPDARLHTTNAETTERYDVEGAIVTATAHLRPGDVMLLEQQTWGPVGCGVTASQFVPVEWLPAAYDAIHTATSLGIIVVEAAGNGSADLDNTCLFGPNFPSGRPDSGAIIVGAGGAPGCSSPAGVRAPMWFTTYGRRVDLQGWGECVVTTGYGDLHGTPDNDDTWYTAGFGGTSGASPIVTGAAAALSSIARQRGLTLAPHDVRARLRATGVPQQNPAAGLIGPQPDLRAAINGLPGGGNPRTAAASSSAPGLPPANAIDGSMTTRWSSGVAQASGQFFRVDLGSPQTFNRLVLDTGSAQRSEYPRRWAVHVSNDGTNWGSPIATGAGNGRLTTIPLPTTTARHVRVSLTGGSTARWSIAELSLTTVTPPG